MEPNTKKVNKYKVLIQILKSNFTVSYDLSKIKRAWNFAQDKHKGQKRLSGEDYSVHCVETAIILASWGLDETSVVSGLLHDTIEDTDTTFSELEKNFGKEVASIVLGVSKVSHIRLRDSSSGEFVENLRKMFFAMAKDLRVVLVKLADRLHNSRTLEYLPLPKQKKIARETLEVFAPLAERLGMGEVKSDLEDLSFPFLDPETYKKVVDLSRSYYKKAEEDLVKMKKNILKHAAGEGINIKINTRKKHIYSLWKKLARKEINWDFSKIHDIVAMRLIVVNVSVCYLALGIVHSLYKPVPQIGISDFIAQPKPNGYRSIHTKVFGPGGRIVEVQIRSKTMHQQAEYGVAAHWAYSEAKTHGASNEVLEKKGVFAPKSKMSWVSELASWQKGIRNSREFIEAVKFDALSHRNFVFSPAGDVYDLPQGATPVDFAYAVHTKLGNFIKAAIVNGKMSPLSYILKSGDVVEITKDKNSKKPKRDWLDFVVTNLAKREIKRNL